MNEAVSQAVVSQLDDGTFAARVPALKGVVAYGSTQEEATDELRSVLDDWLRLGLQLGHHVPVIGRVDLNTPDTSRFALS
jgi:predicted RNase H-like HicB family nuclease